MTPQNKAKEFCVLLCVAIFYLPPLIVGAVSIISMWLLMHYKKKTGEALNSKAILAEAAC
jgi:hypothetical protein